MAPPQKKLKITTGPQELWTLNVCVDCRKPLDSTSKVLECLHGICQPCFIFNCTIPGHCVCKCGKETGLSTGIINYSIVCGKFDESTLRNHYMNQEYQKQIYEKYRTKAPCPNCVDKYIDVYCMTCRIFHCSLCQLMNHRTHEFKTIDAIMEEIRSNLCENKVDLCGKSNFVSQSILYLLKDMNKINMQKVEIKKKIHQQFEDERPRQFCASLRVTKPSKPVPQQQSVAWGNQFSSVCDAVKQSIDIVHRIRAELLRGEKKMEYYVDTYYKEKMEKMTKTCSAIDGLKEKYDFYLNFSESVLQKQNKADLDITHLVNKKLENLRKDFTDDISKLDSNNPNIDLKVKLDDTWRRLNKSVKIIMIHGPLKYEEEINEISKTMSITLYPGYLNATMRDKATSPTIVDDKEVKKITEYNCARQERKSLKSLHSETIIINNIQRLHNHYFRNQPGNIDYRSRRVYSPRRKSAVNAKKMVDTKKDYQKEE